MKSLRFVLCFGLTLTVMIGALAVLSSFASPVPGHAAPPAPEAARPASPHPHAPAEAPAASSLKQRTTPSQQISRLKSLLAAILPNVRAQTSPEALLHRALRQARDAGSYQVHIALDQTITPERAQPFAPPGEAAHFEIEGDIAGPQRARFAIAPGRTSFALARRDPQEFLVVNTQVYRRVGDRWVQEDTAPSIVGIDGDALSLASVAREVHYLDPVEGPPGLSQYSGSIRRVGFKLQPDDVLRFVLSQRGALNPRTMTMARLSAPAIHGTGELWIAPSGLPTRLILNLEWVNQDQDPYRVHVASTTDYSGFGRRFPPGRFDPTGSPETGVSEATAYCVLRTAYCVPQSLAQYAVRTTQYAVRTTPWLLAGFLLLALTWLLIRARRGSRRATITLTAVLIMALLGPTLVSAVEAAGWREWISGGSEERSESPPAPGSELARLLEETRALATQHRLNAPNPANALADMDDQDGDGLPNGYELRLGTNPFLKDTDRDGLSDYDEVKGVPCEWEPLPGQPQIVPIETDPLNPDSNYDGLPDGREYWRGRCTDSYRFGYAWDDDNDDDGVPDGLDLSPFSASIHQTDKLGGHDPGANLTFESLDQNPDVDVTNPYPFYVELQIRPKKADALRWAYKTLEWPAPDHKAAIRHDPVAGALASLFTGKDHVTTGEIQLVPFLQATLRERDLPTQAAMALYGVSVSPHKDDQGNPITENGEALYDMAVPLVPIQRGGQVFAFQAKMLHDQGRNTSLTRQWRDLRLKWAVIGDVLMPDQDGDYVASPDGGYGLVVYDEPYRITGLQVSRQGGTSMLVAAAIPPSSGRFVDLDARIALLRAGLEAQFLTGRLDMHDIQARFDTPNSATDEQRWGIPQTWEYRVKHEPNMHFSHLDAALATTTITTTRQLLNQVYREHPSLEPTLILASEQRTSTVNLDDDPTTDYLDITINTCLKPLVTSRSLKLQKYRFSNSGSGFAIADSTNRNSATRNPQSDGDWVPLSLDEVLQEIEDRFKDVLSDEELNILKMATTAWHTGMTAVQKIGELDVQDIADALSDPEMVVEFLDEHGLIPAGLKEVVDVVLDVIEAGGPQAWLEQQWNKVMGVVDAVGDVLDGSFFDFSGGDFSLPSEKSLLGWTHTAINVLNFLAMVTGDSFFATVAKILTKIIEIYQKIRALWDAIKASIDALKQGAEAAVQTLARELGALSRPLSLVGLLLAVGMVWVGLGLTLQMGDFGPAITLTLVIKAIVETVLLVVLFVVALIFPYGTIVAIAIGFIKFLEDLIGFAFDPVSAFLDWLFSVEAVERVEVIDSPNNPKFGQLEMEPLEPGGGLLSGRGFRIQLPGILTMRTVNGGTAGDLNQSWAELHAGRFQAAPKLPTSICSYSLEQISQYAQALQGFVTDIETTGKLKCVNFVLPREKYWGFDPGANYLGESPKQAHPGVYTRDFLSSAWVDVTPIAKVNGKVFLDVSYDLWIRYDQCSKLGCDEYLTKSTTPPSIAPLYFDILPGWLPGLWDWEALFNPDPDGDGLWGYIDPHTDQPVGPDGNLCSANSWNDWDSDGDGLSDKFELETAGFNPCDNDTDDDGWEDGRELLTGTRPDDPDTDDDGLTDKQELPYSQSLIYSTKFDRIFPWRVALQQDYPGLPDPAAFPNPRQPNLDLDHRSDKQEQAKQTSPNAFNPIPVGEPLELWIRQGLTSGGGTGMTISTPSWVNDEAVASSPTLTVTLPVSFANLTLNAGLQPPVPWPAFNHGALQPSATPNVYTWVLPPIWLGRSLQATLAGIPDIPTGPVTITAELAYTEGGVPQVATAAAPLKVNAGGPTTTFAGVTGAVLLSTLAVDQTAADQRPTTNDQHPRSSFVVGRSSARATSSSGLVTIQGAATDSEGVSQVYVCVKADASACNGSDWQPATSTAGLAGTPFWSYSFTPPAEDAYTVRAYAVDGFGVAGPVSDPITIGVDHTPPSGVTFDLKSTAYVSTTARLGALSAISITGRVSDTLGASYVSGVDAVSVIVGDGDQVDSVSVAEPGQPTSAFTYGLETFAGGSGGGGRTATGVYSLTVAARDLAGNTSTISETLHVLIDDTPPAVYARPPQVLAGTELPLSGLADDTALLHRRRLATPFAPGMTLADADTRFSAAAMGKAVIVGDVTGDLMDDVVLLAPATPGGPPFQVGLFFGQPGGLPDTLSLADADVLFRGELPADLFDFAPDAAGLDDVNGDGVGDFLLGDPSAGSGEGRAYVILGRRGGEWGPAFDLAEADWQLSVDRTTGFGGSVAGAGDVNGDGLADFLVGAASDGVRDGVAWLYLGRERGVAPSQVTFYAPPGAGFMPPNLAGLGDTDGDGLSDFLIAGQDTPVALVHGRPDDAWPPRPMELGRLADVLFDAPGGQQTVSPAGDVDGDGLRDMLIGDPEAEPPHVFLILGRHAENAWPTAPETVDLTDRADASFVENEFPNSRLGAGLTELGDLDGDGNADFAFGQPGTGRGPNRTALVTSANLRAALADPSSPTRDLPVESATSIISGTVPGQLSGAYLSAGDVTGDHITNLLIGASGDNRGYLLNGAFDPGAVSGIAGVEIGLYGPVADPTLPFTATLPSAWRAAALANPGGAISPWSGEVAPSGDGDYRVYARAWDRAGNRRGEETWYLGNVWVNSTPAPIAGAGATMDPPALSDQTQLALRGTVTSTHPIQHLRAFDGYRWHRMVPATGPWALDSTIPRSDRRSLTFRAVARDAFGTTLHASRTLVTDTLIPGPLHLSASLTPNQWHTDIAPSLTISWPVVADASGIVGTWAVIDTISNTLPTTAVGVNQVIRALNDPGVYYGHLRVRDGADNGRAAHRGPFLVNRSQTPSVILSDGYLDFAGGEYPDGTLLNYDPYAATKPAALWGTWDASRLYLGYPGRPWGDASALAIYLDTQSGGLNSTLDFGFRISDFGFEAHSTGAPQRAIRSVTHTLPFAADFAFVVGGSLADEYTLYTASSDAWTQVAAPQSFAVTRRDTEIVLDRSEIQATGAVGLLAFAEDARGIWAVVPGGARPTTTAVISGPVVFGDHLSWPALSDGVKPGDGQDQVIAPVITVKPAWNNVLFSGETTAFAVTVTNPDVGPYENVPLTVQTDPQMVLTGVDGAPCLSCPAGASQWRLAASVEPGDTLTVTLQAKALGEGVSGVLPISITASLANSGLPADPQPAARAQYSLDQGVGAVGFVKPDLTIYGQPGQVDLSLLPNLDLSAFRRCAYQVEANTGAGWEFACPLGDCTKISGLLSASASQVWQVRVSGENRRVSEVISKTVVADSVAPTAQVSPTLVLSGTLGFIRGTAWDDFPTARAPHRIELSVNGGRFQPAFPTLSGGQALGAGAGPDQAMPPSPTEWLFPLRLSGYDGETIQVVARAVDEAGNVGRSSAPVAMRVDGSGPVITASQAGHLLEGTVRDGSGVASVEVSLDSGGHYMPAMVESGSWSFDIASWAGGPVQPFAMVRGWDAWGNRTHEIIPVDLAAAPTVTPTPTATATPTPTPTPTATPTPTTVPGELEFELYLPLVRR